MVDIELRKRGVYLGKTGKIKVYMPEEDVEDVDKGMERV